MQNITVEGMMFTDPQLGNPAIVRVNGTWLKTSPVLEIRREGSLIMLLTRNHTYQTRTARDRSRI